MRRFLFALSVLSPLVSSYPVQARVLPTQTTMAVISGDYGDGMLIGVDPATRIVSGYFQSETAGGRFSCIFYLTGKLRGPDIAITTYFPMTPTDMIEGVLVPESGNKFIVRLADDHGGCWNVQHFADKTEPAEFYLQTAYPWIAIAVAKQKRAYFFDAPDRKTHRTAYIVQGDGVGVRAVRGQWLQVDFIGGNKPVSGWLRTSDVYPPIG